MDGPLLYSTFGILNLECPRVNQENQKPNSWSTKLLQKIKLMV